MTDNYRQSHSSVGYGKLYKNSYENGYNFYQWDFCEKPLLQELFISINNEYNSASMLDFACGTGRITSLAETIFSDCTGVDISETMLEQAQQFTNSTTFIHRDITEQPLNGQYDVITAFRFFNNAEPELAKAVLISLKSNMRENSKLVFNIHRNAEGLLSKLHSIRGLNNNGKINKFYHLDEISALLSETGFKIDDLTWYSFLPKLSRYPDWFLKLGFRQIENIVQRYLPFARKRSQCFLITASIKSEPVIS